jgi:hypothetical protein
MVEFVSSVGEQKISFIEHANPFKLQITTVRCQVQFVREVGTTVATLDPCGSLAGANINLLGGLTA